MRSSLDQFLAQGFRVCYGQLGRALGKFTGGFPKRFNGVILAELSNFRLRRQMAFVYPAFTRNTRKAGVPLLA